MKDMASSFLHRAEVVHVKLQKEAEAIFVGVAKGLVILDHLVASRQQGLSWVAPVTEALLTTKLLALQRPGTRLSRHQGALDLADDDIMRTILTNAIFQAQVGLFSY